MVQKYFRYLGFKGFNKQMIFNLVLPFLDTRVFKRNCRSLSQGNKKNPRFYVNIQMHLFIYLSSISLKHILFAKSKQTKETNIRIQRNLRQQRRNTLTQAVMDKRYGFKSKSFWILNHPSTTQLNILADYLHIKYF